MPKLSKAAIYLGLMGLVLATATPAAAKEIAPQEGRQIKHERHFNHGQAHKKHAHKFKHHKLRHVQARLMRIKHAAYADGFLTPLEAKQIKHLERVQKRLMVMKRHHTRFERG